jgi:hypothetical protein
LLCDGLNECPQEHLPQLLEELDPLLRRKKIACIISTRDAIRHQKITLPISDGACLKIAELTPNDISTLASRAFDNAEEVRDFLHSYRSLADASNSVHLWTPFAVEVGIALWREKSSLPLTIGQMISAVLKGRAEKNQDRLPRYVNAQVVLNLAAALAFELLVTDGRLERDPLNAGKWFNAAKSHCKDALGVSELSDNDILTLLARHELLFVSANGSISFGHQLTAGALAAVFLAKNWKANLSCLGNPVTDDAWIFAANLVKLEESREYIQKLLEVDLILGARATREVGQGIHDEIKNTFSAIAQSNHSQEIRIRGIFALATLGGDGSLLTLKHLARDNDREIAFQAKRGLAVAGDRKFLKHVLEEVDYLRSSPVQHSGGLVSVWDSANLPIKLDLARERLTSCTPGQDVNESFLLLAWEANSYDTDLIESHLRGARDHNAYYFGLYALNQINPQRAKQFVTEGLNESLPALKKIQDILAAGMNGINLDQKFLYQTAISNGSNEENTEELIRGQHLLIELVILKNPIAQDVIQKLEQDLPPSTGNMRQNLWHIALGCRSEKIARYALNIIQDWSDSNDAINACNFLNAQSDLAKKQKKLINLCEIQVEKDNLNSWQLCGIYELIGTLGFSEISANLLNKRIEELSKIRIALEEDRIASLPAATLAILMREPGADLSNSKYAVERMMANCIPAANNAKRFLPKKSLLSLLHTPAGHYSVEADQKNMVSQLSPKEIDEEIQLIKDFWTSLNVVANLSKLGTTQVRISVLRKALQTHYTIPSALNELCRAVDAGWSPDVLRMVVEEVAAIDTWQHSQDFFWDFVEVVARHISADDLKAIHSELPKAKTSFARRILGLWRDYAAGERIGLVRINEPLTSQ